MRTAVGEVAALAQDVLACVRFTRQEQAVVESALELAYRIGQRDGFKEAMEVDREVAERASGGAALRQRHQVGE